MKDKKVNDKSIQIKFTKKDSESDDEFADVVMAMMMIQSLMIPNGLNLQVLPVPMPG